MTTYLRVTARMPGNVKRTVRLEVATDNGRILTGYEVDAEGQRASRKGADSYWVLSHLDIIKRTPLRMNLHYGELEPIT